MSKARGSSTSLYGKSAEPRIELIGGATTECHRAQIP
jgi:hypothetical protein